MSYILDALIKSEQQRLQGEAPLLVSTQLSSNVRKQPALLVYGLVAAILICAGIFIGWLRPWQQDETEAVKSATTLTQDEIKQPQSTSEPLPKPGLLPPQPEKAKKPELALPEQKTIPTTKLASRADRMEQDVPEPSNISAKVAAMPRKSQTSTAVPQVPEQIVDEAATPAMEKSTPPSLESNGTNGTVDETAQEQKQEQRIVAMTELPLAIQQEIPKMSISGHAYSTVPKERIVGINDRLLQEGEYLSPGLRLEQITADGLVFSYKKYLFRHSL